MRFSTLTSVHLSSFSMDHLNHSITRLCLHEKSNLLVSLVLDYNAFVHSSVSNNNMNATVLKFQKRVGQFIPIKWNVSHNFVRMKTIVNSFNCMLLVVLVVLFFFTVQRIITHSGWLLINVIPSAERTVLEYAEGVIKNNW